MVSVVVPCMRVFGRFRFWRRFLKPRMEQIFLQLDLGAKRRSRRRQRGLNGALQLRGPQTAPLARNEPIHIVTRIVRFGRRCQKIDIVFRVKTSVLRAGHIHRQLLAVPFNAKTARPRRGKIDAQRLQLRPCDSANTLFGDMHLDGESPRFRVAALSAVRSRRRAPDARRLFVQKMPFKVALKRRRFRSRLRSGGA